MKLQKNDIVIVTTGKDKGKKGKVLRVFPKKHRVIVEGTNTYVKHVRKQGERSGEKIVKERALPAGNVAIFNPETGKTDRIGYLLDKSCGKTRIFKKTKKAIKV